VGDRVLEHQPFSEDAGLFGDTSYVALPSLLVALQRAGHVRVRREAVGEDESVLDRLRSASRSRRTTICSYRSGCQSG
jgi:hypothetical protein